MYMHELNTLIGYKKVFRNTVTNFNESQLKIAWI